MPLYLLDTNILIDLAGAKTSKFFFDHLLEEGNLRLGTSILCIAEFMAGAGKKEGRFLQDWLKTDELEVLFLDAVEDALRAGEIRKREGLPLPDSLILASTLRAKAHLLTHDETLIKKAKGILPVTDPMS